MISGKEHPLGSLSRYFYGPSFPPNLHALTCLARGVPLALCSQKKTEHTPSFAAQPAGRMPSKFTAALATEMAFIERPPLLWKNLCLCDAFFLSLIVHILMLPSVTPRRGSGSGCCRCLYKDETFRSHILLALLSSSTLTLIINHG